MNIAICIPSSDDHYLNTNACYLYYYDAETTIGTGYSLGLVDKEAEQLPVFKKDLLVLNKRFFDRIFPGYNTSDIDTQYWLRYNKPFFSLEDYDFYHTLHNFYKSYGASYKYIPYYKHKEFCEAVINKISGHINEIENIGGTDFYNNIILPSITGIEESGLKINIDEFNEIYSKQYKSQFVYCMYHPHTTTGRPSNTFDSVNYAALPKKDRKRRCFVSRFQGGKLVEFDFDSYHLRLIGDLLGYHMPEENIYTYFGKYLFKLEISTEEEYINTKNLVFNLLYSERSKEYRHVPFFERVDDFKDAIWDTINTKKYIKSPGSGRIIRLENYEELDRSKLFNYILQMLETENSMRTIYNIQGILKNKKSKIVLYTYDSFLIDYCPEDGWELMISIKNMMGKASIKQGINYADLQLYLY